MQSIRRCNKGTIVDERVINPNRTVLNAWKKKPSVNSWLTVARKKGSTRSSSICE